MTENSVIKHYKKQLIYRQHDLPDQSNEKKDAQHAKETDEDNRIYEFVESEGKADNKIIDRSTTNNGKKTRKKRKNRNCRGQFRHEGMELIKLGTNTTHSLCKTKEPYNARIEKEKPQPMANSNKDEQKVPIYPKKAETAKETNDISVIQNNFADKTIILENSALKPAIFGHALPQMVPERRNSKEMNPKVTTVQYRSPPHVSVPQSDYRVPIHPSPYIPSYPHPLQQNLPFGPYPRAHSPHLPPPPPYPLSRSPPRPVPRSPIRPVPQTPHQHFQKSPVNAPYSGIHFPFTHQSQHRNGYPLPPHPSISNQNPPRPIPQFPPEYSERKKRKHLPEEVHRHKIKQTHPVVAAIDLTVDQNPQEKSKKHHKCQCECGKTYANNPVSQEVIITVAGDKDNLQAPTYFRGKMVNGVLKLETDPNSNYPKGQPPQSTILQNGTNKKHHEDMTKSCPPQVTNVSDTSKPEGKLPPLFLIKDLLAKGVRVEKKPLHHNRILEESHKPSLLTTTDKPKKEEKTNGTNNFRPVPIRTEPNRVIVSTGHSRLLEEPTVRRKSQDHSVSNIIATNNRRQSVDIDTISISSSSSESVRSPRPKSDSVEKQIPKGKLFYYKTNNSFIRYFDDSQKKLFMNNLIADGSGGEIKHALSEDSKEIIELPRNTMFSSKDSLTVEEYVTEMTLAEKYIPQDFFLFYKFVTGYQICNNNLPVSFLTFLKIYNTNGLKVLYERYVSSLKQTG